MARGVAYAGAAACLFLTGCLSPHGVRVGQVDPLGWERADAVALTYANGDSLASRRVSVIVRYDDRYAFDGLPLQIRVTGPDSVTETVYATVPLRHSRSGKTVKYYDAERLWRDSMVFGRCGDYTFRLAHELPGGEAEGIVAVGIHVE